MKKLFVLIAALLPILLPAQDMSQKARSLMQAYSDQQKFSGTVLIASKGKVIMHQAFGFADRDARRINNLDTRFRAGSLTKMFTAVLVMQLAEAKKLSLTDKLNKYIPGADPTNMVTLKNLLSHTSGIQGKTPKAAKSVEDLILGYEAGTPKFLPGEQFEYNNFNFVLLGYIAEKVSAKSFDYLLQQKVFRKADMRQSGIDQYNRVDDNRALGYVTDPATGEWVETGNDESIALAFAAGALYTTAGDLLKWSKAIGSEKLLSRSSWNQILSPVKNDYGFGMMVQENNGRKRIGHTGAIPGYIADLAIYPKDSLTIIYLSNYQDVDGRKLEQNLTALCFNEPYVLPVARQAVALSQDELLRYIGEYQLQPQVEIKVLIEEGKLMAIAPGGDKVELTPEGNDRFFLKGPEIGLEFRRTNDKISALYVDMQGGQLFIKKS